MRAGSGLWLLVCCWCWTSVLCLEPLSAGLAVGGGMVLSAVWSARDRVLCQWKECCETPWLNPNMFPLEERLEDNVFGQHLVTRNIARLNVRFFQCMEVTSPYAIKTQRKARNAPSRKLWVP